MMGCAMFGFDFQKGARFFFAVLVLAANAQGEAQSQGERVPQHAGEEIVVTGQPGPTAQQVQSRAKAITRADDLASESLARFERPICPGIMGLPVDLASSIVDRLRYDARRVGAQVSSVEVCQPNVIIAFVRDGAAEVRKLYKTSGFLFAGLDSVEARGVRNETGPVHAWNVTALRTRFGESERAGLHQGPVRIQGAANLGPVRVVTVPSSDSRIYLASRQEIISSVVVIDVGAIDGLSVNQIADYAAMRAFVRTRPVPGVGAPDTILSLFDARGRGPSEMTDFDFAYLRSVYDAAGNIPALAAIAGILPYMQTPQAKRAR